VVSGATFSGLTFQSAVEQALTKTSAAPSTRHPGSGGYGGDGGAGGYGGLEGDGRLRGRGGDGHGTAADPASRPPLPGAPRQGAGGPDAAVDSGNILLPTQ
jgi:hypothetical protein